MPPAPAQTNVFVVDSPYQMLNAIEAAHALNLTNNHLLIVKYPGPALEAFKAMIQPKHWVSVRFLQIYLDTSPCACRFLGPRLNEALEKWYGRYLHFQRMRLLAGIADSLKNVEAVFLGHYWIEHKFFMRHFANLLQPRKLYLVDDGTDTIDINQRRRQLSPGPDQPALLFTRKGVRPMKGMLDRIRRRYWNWDVSEASSVTFFTTYELSVREGDHLIRNEYRYLRSLAAAAESGDDVYFLGQSLPEDELLPESAYLEGLRKVKAHFHGRTILYVPHPRQSAELIAKVSETLGFEIKKFGVPIEYALAVNPRLPRFVASFYSSALESCYALLGDRIAFAAFYIDPAEMLRSNEEVREVYAYFARKNHPHFRVIGLPTPPPSPAV